MYITIVQSNPSGNHDVYTSWRVDEGTKWKAIDPILPDDTGSMKALFRHCDKADFDKHRKMDINISLGDHAFGINLTLDTGSFRVYQSEPNAIDYKKYKKGMADIWTSAPNVKISGIGIGFLCTTKIHSPDARVI